MILHSAPFASLSPSTLYALLKLRSDVFVVEQKCAYPDLDGRDLEPGTTHIWLTTPIGDAIVHPSGNAVSAFHDVASTPDGDAVVPPTANAVATSHDGTVAASSRAAAASGGTAAATDGAGVVAAYLRVLSEPDGSARIGRVVTSARFRGQGLAGRLLAEAMTAVGSRPAVLDAQTTAVRVYERFGFTPSGPPFIEDGIEHLPMRRPPQATA